MNTNTQKDDAINWKVKGDAYFNSEKYNEAIECYKRAIEIDNEYINAWNNYGYTLIKQGKVEEAKEIKEKIRALKHQNKQEPSFSIINKNRGIIFGVFLSFIFILFILTVLPNFFSENSRVIEPGSTPPPPKLLTYPPSTTPPVTSTILPVYTPIKTPVYSIQDNPIMQGQSGNSIVIIYDGDWWLNAVSDDFEGNYRKEYDNEGNGNDVINIVGHGVTIDGCLMRIDEKEDNMCVGIVNNGKIIQQKCTGVSNLVCFSGKII